MSPGAGPGDRPASPDQQQRGWLLDVAVGVAVGLVGLVEVPLHNGFHPVVPSAERLAVVAAMAVAAGSFRRAPGVALALIWVGCGLQVVTNTPVLTVEFISVLVSFGCARYGSVAVLWASAVSIPAGAAIALIYQLPYGLSTYGLIPRFDVPGQNRVLVYVFVGVTGLMLLAIPWLFGLLLRSRQATRVSKVEQQVAETGREQAEEIARLRASQAQLAHDVHDVVGHSLAVILAQAESAQFLPDSDVAKVKQTLANVATSARESLRDVRRVLAETQESQPHRTPHPVGALDSLIDGVRSAGNEIESVVVGAPQPMPPELDAVAFRVLQEMLTNALKHGRRGEPILVERHWEGDLRIEVRNVSGEPAPDPGDRDGVGVEGMRRRLESVGGHLDVRRREEPRGLTYTATAWVPLRPAGQP